MQTSKLLLPLELFYSATDISPLPQNVSDGVEMVDKDFDIPAVCLIHQVWPASSGVSVLGGVQSCVGVLDVTLLLDPCHLCF